MIQKKVYSKVGYKLPSSFYRSFFRITKLNTSFFLPNQFNENKKVAEEVRNIAKENPKKAIELILNDIAERYMLKKGEMTKKAIKMTKKETRKITT